MTLTHTSDDALNQHATRLLAEHRDRIHCRCDRMFAVLFGVQWVGGIVCALTISPRTWIGTASAVHLHVWASIFFGAAILSLPLWLIFTKPGSVLTRQTVAAAQMLYSALLIHVSGGRIETHFHIFGSLALLAFYRDWRVLATGTIVVALDHMLRGIYWSESVFGVAFAGQWRWLEHVAWVVFEDVFLIMSCVQARHEMQEIARRQADAIDRGEERSEELTLALADRNDLLVALDSGVMMTTTDATGRITSVNDRFCAMTGYTREELIGQDHRIFNSGFHPRSFWQEMYAIVSAGGTWRGEVRNRTKDQRFIWLDSTIKGVLHADGKLKKIVSVRTDITSRKQTELRLQQSQKLESIGQLASGIAHEINTPTQFVGDNLQFLQSQFEAMLKLVETVASEPNSGGSATVPPERRAAFDAAMRQVDYEFMRTEVPQAIQQSREGLHRIALIVRAMKEFSHPGTIAKEPADLNRSILSTVEVCRHRWKYVAELTTELADDLPSVPCVVAEFNQVVLNLIVNAADAIGEQVKAGVTRMGRIAVSTRRTGDAVEVRVEDNGPGMPQAVQPRIFEPFFTTKQVGQGTGQGLTISRDVIVNKHGGELFFDSQPGRTVFVIRLPLRDTTISTREAA